MFVTNSIAGAVSSASALVTSRSSVRAMAGLRVPVLALLSADTERITPLGCERRCASLKNKLSITVLTNIKTIFDEEEQ